MEPAKAKTVKRTQISRDDFADAKRFIDAARKNASDSIEYEALVQAAIIAYARPFSGNERGQDSPSDRNLDPAVVALDGEDRILHDRIITLRNKAVAHAASVNNPVEILPLKSEATITDGFSTQSHRWSAAREQIDLDAFHRIADAMVYRCTDHLLDIVFPGSRQQ